MSFMNKVKNFFYEDVEEDEIEEVVKEKPKKGNKIDFKSFLKREDKIEDEEPEREEVVQKTNNDLSERELFRSERTFNFPMDLGDEIFDEEKEPTIVKEETSRNIYERKEPPRITPTPTRPSQNTSSIYRNISTEEPKKQETKHFRPSPVISPVYGILDKNYTVEDVVERDLNKTKEFSIEKKTVDFDTVRNRAYKDLDEEIEKTLTGDIFYNLDEEDTKPVEEEKDGSEDSNDSVIITYNDEDGEAVTPIDIPDEEEKNIPIEDLVNEEPEVSEPEVEEPTVEPEDEDDDLMPDVKIEVKEEVKPKRKSKKKEEPEEEKEDLFNLIDNMYNEDDEEEEE